jgi:hypothetical protein
MTRPVPILTGPRETPAELLAKLFDLLVDLEDDYRSVIEYGALFTDLTIKGTEGDAELGMNRLAWQIIDHGKAIEAAHTQMSEVVRRLRNP